MLQCTVPLGDATYQIITTGRIPYTKQLPAPPTAPVASTPSSSSVIVRWSAPDNLGDYPVIGYRLVRRAGGSEKMGFGKDIIVDENTFKVRSGCALGPGSVSLHSSKLTLFYSSCTGSCHWPQFWHHLRVSGCCRNQSRNEPTQPDLGSDFHARQPKKSTTL